MGKLIDFFVDKAIDAWIWVEEKTDEIKDFFKHLGHKDYNLNRVEDQIDFEKTRGEIVDAYSDDAEEAEQECIQFANEMFEDILLKAKECFPSLVERIEYEQEQAEAELKGFVSKYINAHFSTSDSTLLDILKMEPGVGRTKKIDKFFKGVLKDAQTQYNKGLAKYIRRIQNELTTSLDGRFIEEERRINDIIFDLQALVEEAKTGELDTQKQLQKGIPLVATADCIVRTIDLE